MQTPISRHGRVAVLAPSGHLDGRAAAQFERDVLHLLASGSRFVIVDCAGVSLLTGSGLRVLLLLAHSVEAAHGRLVLCGTSHAIRSVLQIAGLSRQFVVTASVEEAMKHMPASVEATAVSALAGRVARTLARRADRPAFTTRPATPSPEIRALAGRVMAALERRR
jgi:anti-anti-sigma factor